MTEELDPARRAILTLVCNTVVPHIDHTPDPHGLWARTASEMGVPAAAEQMLLDLPPGQREGMLGLLDILAQQGLEPQTQASREQTLTNMMLMGGTEAMVGVGGLIRLILFLSYGLPSLTEPGAPNPMWAAFGYPGSPGPAARTDHGITLTTPDGDRLELEADVAVVGSGAGGGVIAGTLAQQGLRVVVLEAGGHRDEGAAAGLEVPAYQDAYWRGGPQASADFNFTLMAGSGLGGGTAINWTNSLRTRAWVRDEWANAGLEDVGTDFDRHIDAVWERLGVTEDCSDASGTQQRMGLGAERLGWNTSVAARNVDPEGYDPATAGFTGFGDQPGYKQSTLRTYLKDAFDAGAVIVANCPVERVVVEQGVAAGVVGTWTDPQTGRTAQVIVRAPRVVCAAGALENPALLLRSGIGGPAVGENLFLHPTVAMSGIYEEDLKAWWGAPHALLMDEFESGADADGFGFRVEGAQYAPGLIGSATPFASAADHKRLMARTAETGVFLGRIRDRSGGQVTIDDDGQAVVTYALTDPVDVATMHRALDTLARLHEAAGATEISVLGVNPPTWRRGDDLEAFIARTQRMPMRLGGIALFTAHQMGSCRMGSDPQTSVADPRGELHDTPGVWIGDASAFPTASGTNPMISVMALAHRTADAIAHHAGIVEPVPA